MIKTLGIKNFKGITRTVNFAALNVITGENFAGKTAIFQALTVASLGYLPALGKTGPATFRLASDGTMGVDLETDTTRISRNWRQAGKSIKSAAEGTAPAFSPLNADAFISAQPGGRLAMLAEHSTEPMGELDLVIAELAVKYGPALKEKKLKAEGETSLEIGAWYAEFLGEAATEANARKVQFEKTLAGLTELATLPPAGLPDPTVALNEARERHRAAEQAVGAAEAANEKAADAAAQLAEFATAITKPADFSETAAAYEAAQRTAKEEREQVTLRQTCLSDLAPRTVAACEWREADTARLAELETLAVGWNWDETAQREAMEVLEWEYKDKADADAIEGLRVRIDRLEEADCCPTCKASAEGWKATVAAALADSLAQMETARANNATALAKAMEDAKRSRANAAAIRDELPPLRQLRAQLDGLPKAREEWNGLNTARLAHLAQAEAAEAEAGRLLEIMKGAKEAQTRWEQWEALSTEAAKAPAARAAMDAAYQAEINAAGAVAAIEKDLAAWEENRAAQAAWKAGEQAMTKARVEAEAEAGKLDAIKADAAKLKGTTETELRKLFGKLTALANAFSTGILPSPLELHPQNAQIGRYHHTTGWVPFEAMSGTEQLVATAALQAGLAAENGGVLMLDEMARMRPETKAKFLARIESGLASGLISQAIVIDHTAGAEYAAWEMILA